MIITVTPEDVIRRGLWLEFKKFCLKIKDEAEIQKLITKNQPFNLSEEDAYVVGLLKVVETDNLVHVFKKYMNEVIEVRSTIQEVKKEKKVLINKSTLLKECITYKDRFPHYYHADLVFKKAIEELNVYVNQKYKEFDALESIVLQKNVQGQMKKMTYVYSSNVNKLIKITSTEN